MTYRTFDIDSGNETGSAIPAFETSNPARRALASFATFQPARWNVGAFSPPVLSSQLYFKAPN